MPGRVAPLLKPPMAEAGTCESIYNYFIDVVALDRVCCLPGVGGGLTEDVGKRREEKQARSGSPSRSQSSTGSCSTSRSNVWDRHEGEFERNRLETVILPRLRFNPRPSSSSRSSLRDFFDMFLADDAPHSFRLFHESKGDENVQMTPWRSVANDRTERTVTFQTKISPGSSSNPLSQSERATTKNASVIPLGVAIVQTLVQHDEIWALNCEFTFDFLSTPSSNQSNNNNIGGGVGKKLGAGLGQYFMSNVVKGTTVNVSIILRVCDDADRGVPAMAAHSFDGNANGAAEPLNCHDGIFSCLTHPLLLPPVGVCSSRSSVSKDAGRRRRGKNEDCAEEPSRIGASLLSAIKAKNGPCCGDLYDAVLDVSLAKTPLDADRSGGPPPSNPSQEQAQEDVLRCSSIGSLRSKHHSSFDLTRAPSTIAMRRMILERDGPAIEMNSADSVRARAPSSPPSPPNPPKGLSMRIEMELVGSGGGSGNNILRTSSNSSSLSSSFSRSSSVSAIDEKIRRGLRKRVARLWISWAESWCMRLWEDDESERARRRAIGMISRSDSSSKRCKVNVRPRVRRIGDPAAAKKSSSDKSPKNVWKKLHVGGDDASHRVERWMSSEQEDECGVEVTCMMTPPKWPHSPLTLPTEVTLRKRFLSNLNATL